MENTPTYDPANVRDFAETASQLTEMYRAKNALYAAYSAEVKLRGQKLSAVGDRPIPSR